MESKVAHDSLALGRLPERHARYRPRHAAVIAPAGTREARLDWREFDDYVNRWANALASLGVWRGDRVATLLPNSIELLASYWACFKLGAVSPDEVRRNAGAFARPVPAALWRDLRSERLLRDDAPVPA